MSSDSRWSREAVEAGRAEASWTQEQAAANRGTASGSPPEQVLFEVKHTIVGQDVLLERMAIAMLASGHLLVEGIPGLGKTLAVKSLAGAIGGEQVATTTGGQYYRAENADQLTDALGGLPRQVTVAGKHIDIASWFAAAAGGLLVVAALGLSQWWNRLRVSPSARSVS